MRHAKHAFWLFAMATMLAACAQLGIPTADTVNEKIAAALVLNTGVRNSATSLLASKTISAADGQNILDQTNNVRAGIDVTRTLAKTDMTAADARITQLRTVLLGIQAYLATKKGAN